ncbi:MAG: hypothetical protein LBC99_01210 [Spirochaetota bacterium]|jgi:hypothetical protein|nr:hypothetical protein [Spirochaetota bacterium]
MKKCFPILCLLCILAACSKNDAAEIANNKSTVRENPATIANGASAKTPPKIDVDLTVLSATMVYAEVYNIMTQPNEYMGKTIRMSGPYYASYPDKDHQYHHYVIIEDASACCKQGLEFIRAGDHDYPNDYPENETKIEVTGVFNSYEKYGQNRYYVMVDEIMVKK